MLITEYMPDFLGHDTRAMGNVRETATYTKIKEQSPGPQKIVPECEVGISLLLIMDWYIQGKKFLQWVDNSAYGVNEQRSYSNSKPTAIDIQRSARID